MLEKYCTQAAAFASAEVDLGQGTLQAMHLTYALKAHKVTLLWRLSDAGKFVFLAINNE